jgi:hypothetical protein
MIPTHKHTEKHRQRDRHREREPERERHTHRRTERQIDIDKHRQTHDRARTEAPRVIMATKATRQVRTPNLSTKKPPRKGRKMLGMEYTVYSKLKYVS